MLLNPIAYFGALYLLTKADYSQYHGLFALLVAAYYLGLERSGTCETPVRRRLWSHLWESDCLFHTGGSPTAFRALDRHCLGRGEPVAD